MLTTLTYPAKGALIRFGRAILFAGAAAVIGVALNELPIVVEGTTLAFFVPIFTAALLSADKYIREKRAA
jgi:hypothetical protein